MKNIAVYCGAAMGNDKIYQQATLELADYLVEHNLGLVYGGGSVGLMGLLAKRVLQSGGQVQGVITRELVQRGAALVELADLQVVKDMSERKQRMLELSDGCIALPGGPGTLEEISQSFSWTRLGDYTKPCVLYNVGGYYDSLKTMFQQMVAKDFLTARELDKLLFSDSLTEIFDFIENYLPPQIRTYN
ncbi:LOG family protein [Bombilactobacillus bombi]|uniref:LOG family protein n=1 Tax=Bombilactobacillus bombi TaxID=1303590 RepID=UPI0015E5E05D|nr:TIGR00730 family Rossman fold protein [Bombilactobacillus bombi]MBA1433670.1 TIGR00730 family Rossman fold protein [Bombilactobacillus bombi]